MISLNRFDKPYFVFCTDIPLSGGSGGSPQNFNLGVPPPPFPSRANRMSSMEIR